MNPTTEQLSILHTIQATRSPIMINALAGTGKTSTLKMVETVINDIETTPILYLVFNSANAKAAEYKPRAKDSEKRMLSSTTVKTMNSFGHGVWARSIPHNCYVDLGPTKRDGNHKIKSLLTETLKELPKPLREEASDAYWEIVQGVAMAKALGYCPERYYPNAKRLATADDLYAHLDEEPSEVTRHLIDEILVASIKQAYQGCIDFNDQVYMPALFGGSFPRFPYVMVDEFQDLNPTNHALCDKLFARSRGVGVGDPWQSIYAFRGARQNGMEIAKTKHTMTEQSLSVSFRCPRAIVEAARWRVPHFKWIKDGGHVSTLSGLAADDIPDSAVFICRNNAPLFRMGFRLLSRGRGVTIAGSDIGPRLIATMRKLGPETLNRIGVISAIDAWQLERVAKGSKSALDMADCMRVFAEHGANLGQAIAYAEHLFSQRGMIRMMTGHKSKGLEFDLVYHLDPWLCGDDEQDKNLRYVITTRSAGKLYEINSECISW